MLLCSVLLSTSVAAIEYGSIDKDHYAKCTGSVNCRACKTCNYCAHCNSGGSCGVCSSGSSIKHISTFKSSTNSSSSQCKGITKKGARCKRMVRGGGYCWQHS
ncbi:DUF5763 domain-containing protein [Pedobacter sp. HMWF019]|uniref:DUF5763 domain-containing protein n=1 Tax=Pedobacter sp. HMWF019 TaxID=2056856 RepID=UPI00351413CC